MREHPVYFKKKPMFDRSIYSDAVLTQFADAIGIPQKRKWELSILVEILNDDQLTDIYDQVVCDD